MKYIVELEENVWIADTTGDPGRTVDIRNAQLFTQTNAKKALKEAQGFRAFEDARIINVTG